MIMAAKTAKAKVVKAEQAAKVAAAPKAENSKAKALKLRAEMKSRRPTWIRQQADQLPRLRRQKRTWRRPKGLHSKLRQKHKGRFMPSPSYGAPRAVRGLHPSGLEERLVTNIHDLDGADAKRHALRISASIGMRKKIQIVEQAKKAGIRVLNPKIIAKAPQKEETKKEEAPKETTGEKAAKAPLEEKKE